MASSSEKPVIVVVHGAWHSPFHFKRMIKALREAGYTILAPQLTTAGPDDSIVGKTIADDVARIAEITAPYLDAGRELVFLSHSYGGMPTTQFCGGRSVRERAQKGLKGGVKAVVYMCAFAPTGEGKTASPPPSKVQFADFHYEAGYSTLNEHAADALFGEDIPDPKRRQEFVDSLGFHSAKVSADSVTPSAPEIQVDKYYALCLKDGAISAADQRYMAEKCGAEIVEFDAGHSPFLVDRHIENLVSLIERAGGKQ